MVTFNLVNEEDEKILFSNTCEELSAITEERSYFRNVVKIGGKRFAILRNSYEALCRAEPSHITISAKVREIGKEAPGYKNNR